MTVYLYETIQKSDGAYLRQVKDIKMAGSYALQSIWNKRGRPRRDWHISHDELVQYALQSAPPVKGPQVLIDVKPRSEDRINLVALDDVYVFTILKDESTREAEWSVYMLRCHDLIPEKEVSPKQKATLVKCFKPEPGRNEEWFTILYLRNGWKPPGPSSTNGAWLNKETRNYFKQFWT